MIKPPASFLMLVCTLMASCNYRDPAVIDENADRRPATSSSTTTPGGSGSGSDSSGMAGTGSPTSNTGTPAGSRPAGSSRP